MIDPERLIGGLLFGGLGKGFTKLGKKKKKNGGSLLDGAFGSTTKTAIGMGALGVGIAAFEHFMSQRQSAPSVASPASSYAPPPPPPPSAGIGMTPPPPPPAPQSAPARESSDGILLIRAAIAAANADGAIDAGERTKILQQLETIGITAEERAFLASEFLSPATLETIVAQVHTPELAEQIYAISLLTLEVDTEAERNYLSVLKERLKLSDSDIQRIHTALGFE